MRTTRKLLLAFPLLNYDVLLLLHMSGLQSKLSFNDWGVLQQLFTKPLSDAEDLLWHLGWFVKNEASSRPRWAYNVFGGTLSLAQSINQDGLVSCTMKSTPFHRLLLLLSTY